MNAVFDYGHEGVRSFGSTPPTAFCIPRSASLQSDSILERKPNDQTLRFKLSNLPSSGQFLRRTV